MKNRLLLAAAIGMVAAVGAVSPASASENISWFYTADGGIAPWNDAGAKARFEHNGDIFQICDNDADGFSARGFVYRGTRVVEGRHLYMLEVGSEGRCEQRSLLSRGLDDGVIHTFRVCLSVPNKPQLGQHCRAKSAKA